MLKWIVRKQVNICVGGLVLYFVDHASRYDSC